MKKTNHSTTIATGAVLGLLAITGAPLAEAQNVASGNAAFIGGGLKNTASGNLSSILGGFGNTASAANSNILGGNGNTAAGGQSGIITGTNNTVTGAAGQAAIISGNNNSASGLSSGIFVGNTNSASGSSAVILTGRTNVNSGNLSVLLSGDSSTLGASDSLLFGSDIRVPSGDGIVYLADDSRGGTQLNQFIPNDTMVGRFNGGFQFYTSPTSNSTGQVIIDPNGQMGVGISSPTVPLQVGPGVFFSDGASITFFDPGSTSLTTSTGARQTSIKATNGVEALAFIAISDERIKDVKGISDGSADLDVLRQIEITDYTHKDKVLMGSEKYKKVIAQQVEKVYPIAVNQGTDVIPDIYQKAPLKDGWVELATDLAVGERVRLIDEAGALNIYEVAEVAEGKFRTTEVTEGAEVFVYGREVDDFRSVDYEAIAMLNVSATQELARKLEKKEAELAELKAEKDVEIAKLVTANENLAQKFAELIARDEAREKRLARLEQNLGDVDKTVPVSLSVSN